LAASIGTHNEQHCRPLLSLAASVGLHSFRPIPYPVGLDGENKEPNFAGGELKGVLAHGLFEPLIFHMEGVYSVPFVQGCFHL